MLANPTTKQALILIDSHIEKEPRVIREIEALKNTSIYPIAISFTEEYPEAICYQWPEADDSGRFKHFSYPLFIRKFVTLTRKIKGRMWQGEKKTADDIFDSLVPEKHNISTVIAHHLHLLPTGYFLAKKLNTKLVFNAHEYYPEQFSGSDGWEPKRKYLNRIGRRFLRNCDKIFNVTDGIQQRYEREFGLKKEQQILILNATSFNELQPTETNEKIKIIHHGIADEKRKLELMLEVTDLVDKSKFEFYFMLIPSSFKPDYFQMLKAEIEKRPNCKLIPPVPTIDIAKSINKFDVGFYMYDNSSNFNMQHYLPNKFFEFIQARLAVVIGPYIEMEKLIEKYQLGMVAKSNTVEEVAKSIGELTMEKVKEFKKNANAAAKQLAGEREIEKMAAYFATC